MDDDIRKGTLRGEKDPVELPGRLDIVTPIFKADPFGAGPVHNGSRDGGRVNQGDGSKVFGFFGSGRY